MYVEVTGNLKVNLMDMTFEQAVELKSMIEGAGLPERQTFGPILRQLNQPIDKLMK